MLPCIRPCCLNKKTAFFQRFALKYVSPRHYRSQSHKDNEARNHADRAAQVAQAAQAAMNVDDYDEYEDYDDYDYDYHVSFVHGIQWVAS